ncbi:MAG TPA: hypothetical protein VF081_07965 [Solirubrobacterales bacterium]
MKLRLSPAGVLAVIALVVALAGTAYAAGVFTPEEEVEIRKLSTEVFDGLIGDASVKHAASADTATTAVNANTATSAATATRATSANNSEQLGGLGAGAYQRTIQGGCAAGSSIANITPQGQVTCSGNAVQAIRLVPRKASSTFVRLANGVTVAVLCTTNPTLEIHNNTLGQANLNYSELKPGSTRVAGEILFRDERHSASFTPRMDAQYTFLSPQGVTTVSLHAFDGNGFCEISGTAVTAFG